jgi:hypothetical protein
MYDKYNNKNQAIFNETTLSKFNFKLYDFLIYYI